MTHLNLVADELHKAGFGIVQNQNSVSVYLKNRKPSAMEVETALDQIFEGIEFQVKSTSNAVIVKF